MASPEDEGSLLEKLTELGGRAGNTRLRTALGWKEGRYWDTQGVLVEKGSLIVGRGKGGSVRLPDPEIAQGSSCPEPIEQQRIAERALYAPALTSLREKWLKSFGFDRYRVEETHSQGSKPTGGTFTRPDITAVGLKTYVYLTKTIEVLTFELKAKDCINIMGVLEAIAHQQAANRSYVLYHAGREEFDQTAEAERIFELAQRNGIGIILAEDVANVETWEVPLAALRWEPDPSRLDRFLRDLPNKDMQDDIQRWKS